MAISEGNFRPISYNWKDVRSVLAPYAQIFYCHNLQAIPHKKMKKKTKKKTNNNNNKKKMKKKKKKNLYFP